MDWYDIGVTPPSLKEKILCEISIMKICNINVICKKLIIFIFFVKMIP